MCVRVRVRVQGVFLLNWLVFFFFGQGTGERVGVGGGRGACVLWACADLTTPLLRYARAAHRRTGSQSL